MSVHRRTATLVVARQLRQYKPGDKVRVLRGKTAGQEVTIVQSDNDWVRLEGSTAREVMSKGNVEPVGGFTDEELFHAKRAAEKMRGLGSYL